MISSRFLHFRFLALFIILITLWAAFHFLSQSDVSSNIESNPLSDGEARLFGESELDGYENSKKPVTLTVFFESLCPDSLSFVVDQLLPTVKKLSQFVKVDLVPYGKATTTQNGHNNFTFVCQHGPNECLGNKVMACALHHIRSSLEQTKLTACIFEDNYHPLVAGEKCCKQYSVHWQSVHNCAIGSQGSVLLNKYGVQTHSLKPKLKFVPTCLINHKWGNQAAILKDLKSEVCTELKTKGHSPSAC